MKSVFTGRIEADEGLLHLLRLLLLHKVVPFPFGGHHLVSVVTHKLFGGLSGCDRPVSFLIFLSVHQHVLLQDAGFHLLVSLRGHRLPVTYAEGGGAELDVSLDDEAHGLLHVSLGDGQRAPGLGEAALGEHLQQVLLLGLPLRQAHLGGGALCLCNKAVCVSW